MCGRYARFSKDVKLLAAFAGVELDAEPFGGLQLSFNITPTESILIVRANAVSGKREFAHVRWGLVPSWAKDLKIGAKMINARADTVAVKPSFRAAFKRRRCLVLADGFYEWKRDVTPSEPWYFCMADRHPFAIAGLWETWKDPAGKVIESAAMITTEANALMRPVHHRMPVILDPKDFGLWLDPAVVEPERLTPLLTQFPADRMSAWKVSRLVNIPANDDERCIVPAPGT